MRQTHQSLLLLACAALAAGCTSAKAPTNCNAVPQPSVDQCLDNAWMQAQADALPAQCTDQLLTRCYDQLGSVQNASRLEQAACDDYWKPCMAQGDCTPGDKPRICYRTVLALYPTAYRSDGFFTANQIGMTCRRGFVMGKPPVTGPGNPLDQYLQEKVWARINPWYEGTRIGVPVYVDPTLTMPSSLSTPAEPLAFLPIRRLAQAGPASGAVAPQAVAVAAPTVVPPGSYSLNIGALALTCTADGPPEPNLTWTANAYFDDPIGQGNADIASVASCQDYAMHKYYDWSVFRIRMSLGLSSFDEVPDILRVDAAYSASQRGNVGWLMQNLGVVSRAWYPGNFSVGSNPTFPLTAGVAREQSLVLELLMGAKKKITTGAPADHAHRVLFTADLAGWSQPCSLATGLCFSAAETENWEWHGAARSRYREQAVTPFQEATMRLYRQQLLELYARRAQLELAGGLGGKDVTAVALDTLWAPSGGLSGALRAYALARGELATTLTTITGRERSFLRDQFARDWPDIKADVAARTQADLEARLASLDEYIEDAYTRLHDYGYAPSLASCIGPNPHVLCTWLPEMFVDRFQGIREEALLNVPSLPEGADFANVGPSADQRRCQGFLRGANWTGLKDFTFRCPLNSQVNGTSKFEVCGCNWVGPDAQVAANHWDCGEEPGHNPDLPLSDTTAYPVFYKTTNYRSDHLALERFIERTQKMNQVAFAVATAFIPPCSATPTMTETHVATQNFGSGLFGATLGETFTWSKDGLTDHSVLDASASVSASFVGITPEFLAVSAHGERAAGGTGSGTLTLRVAGEDMHWPLAQKAQQADYTGWSGSYYFSIGPIPVSVSWGVGGGWSAGTHVGYATAVDVGAKASARASLFIDGGIDVGIAGAGVGASIDIVEIGPDFTGSLGMRKNPIGKGQTGDIVLVSSTLKLDTTLLSGRFYAWAKVGACPFCKKFDATLFDWTGFHQGATVWTRRFPLPETSLDKLQGWSTKGKPDSCY